MLNNYLLFLSSFEDGPDVEDDEALDEPIDNEQVSVMFTFIN